LDEAHIRKGTQAQNGFGAVMRSRFAGFEISYCFRPLV